MTTSATLAARKTALFARTSTPALVVSLTTLNAIEAPSQEERMTHAWIRDEIERRVPAVRDALAKAFDDASAEEERTGEYVDVDYDAVILSALRA